MRIAIESIPDDGVYVDVQSDTAWAIAVASAVLETTAATLQGQLHVTQKGGAVRVRGEVSTSGDRVCERCGESTTLQVSASPDLAYVPADHAPTGHDEVGLSPGGLDVGWFSGGAIDLTDVMSEALALALPTRIVCANTPECDERVSNLLEAQQGSGDDHPFAALRQLT